MNKIKLLDNITIQQIAAGEIIDRPSSIVKELVENSIDAGSTTIVLEIKNGGKSYIRVTDNGSGIDREDIPLAFKRHSTSKLDKAEDLYDINSFGFRGEALSSISSVARVELLTKTREDIGTISKIEDGDIINTDSVGCPNGTTLVIEDIFYNFPVRKDFLKSDLVEANRITDTVIRLSIGNPSISFKYIKDDKVIFKTPGKGNIMEAIYATLGKDFKDNLVAINYSDVDIKISGFISKNSFYRSNRSHQYLYVNNRFIKNNDITNILEDQYKSLIPINRYPIFFLFIDINPSMVDVNIHPTKQEINFVNQDNLLAIVGQTIKKSLLESLTIQRVPDRVKKASEELPKLYESTFFDEDEEDDMVDEKVDIDSLSPEDDRGSNIDYINATINKLNPKETFSKDYNITSLVEEDSLESLLIKEIENREKNIYKAKDEFREDRLKKDSSIENPEKQNEDLDEKEDRGFKKVLANLNVKGIIFNTYILGEDSLNQDLILIDQHAAHERIMYEEFLAKYTDSSVSSQILMSPHVLELSDIELGQLKKNLDFFNSVGLEIDLFGGNSIIIRGVPVIFGNPEPENIFYDILDNLSKDIDSPYQVKLEKIMKLACTSAVKSGDKLKDIEIQALIESLLACKMPFTCPHGRPTVIKIGKTQIEKDFKRIM